MNYVFIELISASRQCTARSGGGGRIGWYMWCQWRIRISTRRQFRQHCDSVVLVAFTRSCTTPDG
nr:orf37 [Escherichia coli B171]